MLVMMSAIVDYMFKMCF